VDEAPPLLTFLVLGAGIGFVAGVSPGDVLTLVVQETLRGGWLRGAAVAAGPLLADGPIIAVALLLVGQFPAGFVPAISLVGGLFLLYLAVTTGLTARQAALPRGQRLAARGRLLTGVVARASSPNPYLFWVLVGTPALLQAGRGAWWSGAILAIGGGLASQIRFDPELPELRRGLHETIDKDHCLIKTHTTYDRPFWRDQNASGQIVSPDGVFNVSSDATPRTRPRACWSP
jgi:threonine/homoserine/homoserine lactone efflux protein